jgi:hypothetical protein
LVLQNIPLSYQIVSNPPGKPVLFSQSAGYLFLGLIQRPPTINESKINTTATHENVVLSVASPMTKQAMPRMRKIPEGRRLFCCMI